MTDLYRTWYDDLPGERQIYLKYNSPISKEFHRVHLNNNQESSRETNIYSMSVLEYFAGKNRLLNNRSRDLYLNSGLTTLHSSLSVLMDIQIEINTANAGYANSKHKATNQQIYLDVILILSEHIESDWKYGQRIFRNSLLSKWLNVNVLTEPSSCCWWHLIM